MKVPKKIKKRFEEIEDREKKANDRARQAKLREEKLEKDTEDLRNKNKKSLMAKAVYIANWINKFFKSKDGKRCVKKAVYVYGLILFWSNDFWNGYPSEPSSATVGKLILGEDGSLKYTENYKWFPPGFEIEFGKCPLDPKVIFQKMHPKYLENCHEHLKSKKVWDTIEREIKPL